MRQRAKLVPYEAFYLIVSKQIDFDERSVVLGYLAYENNPTPLRTPVGP